MNNKKKLKNIYRVKDNMGAELLNSNGQLSEPSTILQTFCLVRAVSEILTLSDKKIIKVKPYRKKSRKFFKCGWLDYNLLTKVFEN